MLHVHSNVNSGDEDEWMVRLVSELKSLAETNGRGDLDIVVEHLERVKWYGPRIRHVVCDVRCTSRTHKDDLAPTRNMAPKSARLGETTCEGVGNERETRSSSVRPQTSSTRSPRSASRLSSVDSISAKRRGRGRRVIWPPSTAFQRSL